jgi:hypothetical protein
LVDLLVTGKNRVWGLGPEATVAIASKKKKKVYGFLTARYLWEMGAHTATQGTALSIMAAIPLRPIAIP